MENQTAGTINQIQKKYPELAAGGFYGPKTISYLEKLLVSQFKVVPNPSNILVLVNKSNSLTADYVPQDLVIPNVKFTFDEIVPQKYLRQEAAAALEQLFAKAKQDNISLVAVSGYRSFDRQADIFARNFAKSPNANIVSALPGESEPQTGLAIDVSSPSVNYLLTKSFGETVEGHWLNKNAAQYGFIIRYPEDKESITGYQYEPWHIRYVGKAAAVTIMEQGLTLEEYLSEV